MSNFGDQVTKMMRMARIALTPRWMRIQTRLPCGIIVTGRNIKGYGGRGIYISRENIEPEFQFLNSFVSTDNVFVDVGANVGIFTLKAAKAIGPGGVVLSLEPFPEMLSDLAHNVNLNRLDNVRIRGLCAAGRTAPDSFWTNFGKPNSFSLVRRDEHASQFSVLKVKLDDLFSMEGLSRCDYIKIDAEGSEQEIIEGARHIIESYRPIIQAEILIADFQVKLDDYAIFQAKYPNGRRSPNKLFIPKESPKIKIAQELGLEACG